MISGGVASILLFEGFVHRMVAGLRETTIRTQTGHLTIANKTFWAKTGKTPKENLIPHYKNVIEEVQKDPHVRYASGRITFYGLLNKNDRNVSAQGISFDPIKEASRSKAFKFIHGSPLSAKNPMQIGIGSGLATRLNLKLKDSVVIMVQTYDGVVNALDLEVGGIFRTAISEFDNNTFLIPLQTAQKLLDTKSVEQIVIGLDSTSSTSYVKSHVEKILTAAHPSLAVQTWFQQAILYRQVAQFSRIQSRLFQVIVLTLVLLSILNTVGMSVLERTGEIGMTRSLGETRGTVVFQFFLEGICLGVLGAITGLVVGTLMTHGINAAKIPIPLPGANTTFPLRIDLMITTFRDATLFAVLSAAFAALIPSFRASRLKIVEALRHSS
jgi:putative ABC transport system permease protein